ncbi:MAG TPA: biotin/lipoyl-containing protein [Polyangia bacterium]|nr:biotin/lipoyl-containing protein [Polyangia bacterium]
MIHRFSATVGTETRNLTLEPLEGGLWRVTLDGQERIVDARRIADSTWSILPPEGGPARLVDVDPVGNDLVATVGSLSFPIKLADPRRTLSANVTAARGPAGPLAVRSSMPGKVIKVQVKAGADVTAGQSLVIVEAMKMENPILAPRAGKIVQVHVEEGQAVEANQTLVTLG